MLVGRIKKYSSFTDYVRRALKRLKIPEQNQPSNDRLEYYYAQFLPRLTELQRYLQVCATFLITTKVHRDNYSFKKPFLALLVQGIWSDF